MLKRGVQEKIRAWLISQLLTNHNKISHQIHPTSTTKSKEVDKNYLQVKVRTNRRPEHYLINPANTGKKLV